MAERFVNRGLQVAGGRLFNTADAFDYCRCMVVDDRSTAWVAGDTTLGSPTNLVAKDYDSTPTRSGQQITCIATIPQASVLTIRRISHHNLAAASVTGTSASLVHGLDGQSFTKGNDFTLQLTAVFQVNDA